jgi:hypothetical protein
MKGRSDKERALQSMTRASAMMLLNQKRRMKIAQCRALILLSILSHFNLLYPTCVRSTIGTLESTVHNLVLHAPLSRQRCTLAVIVILYNPPHPFIYLHLLRMQNDQWVQQRVDLNSITYIVSMYYPLTTPWSKYRYTTTEGTTEHEIPVA